MDMEAKKSINKGEIFSVYRLNQNINVSFYICFST